ncbi:DUF6702 family protein [Catenovulum sediminis]|uniref:DUF6702 family protein n=1 Tax=Catenovulum sediminis TaxID=1740262 RepID=A0ABV1RIQ2_9ALTE|nr:DUF6702 family protein [Catenovulum sediminis]
MKLTSNKLLGGLAFMFFLPFNSQAEEQSGSSTELSVDGDTVKLALKVNKKLIEHDLQIAEKLPEVDLSKASNYQTFIEYYFQEYLPVTKENGQPVNLAIKSTNVEGDTVVFNLEAPLENANMLSINNRVLFDSNEEQVNKVQVQDHSYTFTNAVDEPLIVWQKEGFDGVMDNFTSLDKA